MNILVTGGGGFIGMALIRRLISLGHKVTSFSRREYPLHWALGIKSIQGDITNHTHVEEACKGKDLIFHIAARVGISGSYDEFYSTNVTGTETLINECLKAEVSGLVFTSTSSVVFDGSNQEGIDEVYPYPSKQISHYASTKAIAEKLILDANSESLKTIALRPYLVWGPYDTHLIPGILRRAATGRLRMIDHNEYRIDTTYIDNLIDAQILAADAIESKSEACGEAIFITNGEPVWVWEFINSVLQMAGYKPVQKRISERRAFTIARSAEFWNKVFRIKKEPFLTYSTVKELCTHHWFDISKARQMLGYSPGVSHAEGLKILGEYLGKGRR